MGRTKGTYTLTSNIEPKVGAPLDARTVVPLKTDLTANGTFDYPYIGLSVFVREDNKRYTLIGTDPTVAANWREEGSGTSTSADHVTYDNRESGLESVNIQDAVDEIVDNLGSAAYKDVPESGNADATQVVMGNDSRLTDSRNANDVYPWAKSVNKPEYTYSEIQNTPTLGTAAAKNYTTSVTEDSNDLVTSGAVYDALENIPSDDTWRNIKVNGTEKLGTATNTGAVDFVNGTNTSVSFDSSGNKIKIDAVDTTYEEATTSTAGLMSASDKTKLNGIATGAEINVQSDWNQTATTADDYIKNKPTIPPAVAVKGDSETAYRTGNVNITKGNIGLGNVDNTSDATKKTNFTGSIASGNTGFVTGGDVYTALNGKLNTSLKGAANGLAELDADGKVPSSQLPSYVDDVIEVADYAHLPITGESGKIYVTLDTNLTYRWTGTGYTEISASLALGETSSTAYRGDRGKTAYDHATESGKISAAVSSGLYKIAATAQGHIASLTAVQKSDITALGIPGSDTNTHRPIQVNGTQNLGDNTTPLNLKNGTNITVTADGGNVTIATSAEVNQNAFSNVKVGSTTVAADSKTDTLELVAGSNVTITPDATNDKITIAATDTKYTAATAAPGNIATSGAVGTSTNYARQDHTHGISLATGDANGQVKIAGTNVSVKGLGSNAYSSTAYLPLAGGTMTGPLKFRDQTIPQFSGNPPYLLGIESFASGGDVKWQRVDSVNVGRATLSDMLIEADYTNNNYVRHTDNYRLKASLTRQNKCGINSSSSAGGLLIAGSWSASSYNAELYIGMGDNLNIFYRGVNASNYTDWYPLGRFTQTAPTSGQVVITDGTGGGIKASGYTIAKSVPSNAVFTDTHRPIQVNGTEILGNNTTALNLKAGSNISLTNSNGTVTIAATNTLNTAGSTDTSSKIFLIGATSQAANPQTYSDDQVYVTSGTLQTQITKATAGVYANTASNGAAGGVSLYGSSDPHAYGVTMRNTGTSTGQLGKHGYVQGDWAGYLCFDGATNRGWVFRQAGNNIASVSGLGHAVFNGSVTVGGNAANTSGCRMVYDSTNECMNLEFAS